MARPQKYDEEGNEIQKPTVVYKYKKPKLEPADPVTGFRKASLDNDFAEILIFYGKTNLSEKSIRVLCGATPIQWEQMMMLKKPETDFTYREILDIARAHQELKLISIAEEILDSPDAELGLKYKIAHDQLREMPEHAPATSNQNKEADAPTFTGYSIVVLKKEEDGNSSTDE
jgi:hypothetical protein